MQKGVHKELIATTLATAYDEVDEVGAGSGVCGSEKDEEAERRRMRRRRRRG